MTPLEIFEMADGYQERLDTQMHLLAWHAANVMNVHLKKKVTVKKLLGEKTQSPTDIQKKIKQALELVKEGKGNNGSNNSIPSD